MKVLLNYGIHYNQGKQYQAKFIYDNQFESENVASCINSINSTESFQPTYSDENNIITNTNIKKEALLPFLKLLLTFKDTTIIIGKQEFKKYNHEEIKNAIDKIHINITLKKGKYFNLQNCYYVTFKYASEEQKNEVTYDFTNNLSVINGYNHSPDSNKYLFPFITDANGNITFKNTGIIGGTNIPEETLPFFITRFIKEYNAILHIDNQTFRELNEIHQILTTVYNLNRVKTKKKSI